jgi:hypothetical protein
MFYIHHSSCISAQQTFENIDLTIINLPVENKFKAVEPSHKDIPVSVLRRMGKAVRMGIGTGIPLIHKVQEIKGIIIGTANGGMEDCIKFLNQIIQYEEGTLTPTNFVQSTANNIASQTALMSTNKGYNITHVHRGLAFENAVIDADMMVAENPTANYLLGGIDEISNYNYKISFLEGLYKAEDISIEKLYDSDTPGSIAGEGSAMFIVNGVKEGSVAQMKSIKTLHSSEINEVSQQFADFIKSSGIEKIDLFISGENGDSRYNNFYTSCENITGTTTARFKHFSGDFPTASAMSLWIACHIMQTQHIPEHLIKSGKTDLIRNIVIYNNYKGYQHSFMLLTNN